MGRAIALRLVREGMAVVAVDVDESGLEALQQEAGAAVSPLAGDVSDRSTSERARAVASELGDLRGWVNNAGIDLPGAAHNLQDADLHRLLDVNLIGVIWGCCDSIGHFLERGGGAIVSISSIQAVCGFPESFVYAASKGGINSLTRQIATEYGPFGIRANAVMPGAFRTRMAIESWERAPDPAAAERDDARLHPLGRLGEPEEVAATVAFLLSAEASFISGQCIAVDGGASARCFVYPPNPELVDRYGLRSAEYAGEVGDASAGPPTE
jgi:NAD(P)-dependent dehydrogenase (short-subunit alcohol dehydrogenase family)